MDDEDDTSLSHVIGYAIGLAIRTTFTITTMAIRIAFIVLAVSIGLTWLFLLIIIGPAVHEKRAD